MTPTRWQHIQEIFNEAIDHPLKTRTVFLMQVCGSDPELLREIQGLVESYDQADNFLEGTVEAGASDLFTAGPGLGERVGTYEITGLIGTGGMGAVYRAHRIDDEFRQTVAIKVLRGGAAVMPAELRTRFRTERQILARLTHPNIARLLDGGITHSGLPYLVMECVEGSTLDAYIRQSALDLSARINLFCQLCSAVQYAHQNLIVHRDIKPSNIMVTRDGVPKLLDFGIAKLLTADALGQNPLTRPAERLMTPGYASPEQIRGEPVTTATDVYALGVLLYELISGTQPFDAKNLSQTALERLICETTPQRPSAAAVTHLNSAAERIGSDLDNIVLKALQNDPVRRYASAAELSEDLRRYQRGFPVRARADSCWYRASRFIARHRVATTAAMLSSFITTLLIISLAFATHWARR